MGFLSGITDTLFGDGGKKAVRVSREEAAQNREFIREGQAQALDYIGGAFPQAQAQRDASTLAAMGVYADTAPQAFDMFSGGNFGAQQVTAAAPMQIQNALLGLPVDYNFLQPRQQQADFGFMSQGLPQAPQVAATLPPEISPETALGGMVQNAPDMVRMGLDYLTPENINAQQLFGQVPVSRKNINTNDLSMTQQVLGYDRFAPKSGKPTFISDRWV